MPGSSIELRGVNKVFHGRVGATAALQDVNLTVPAGQFVTIVGPSGCGKSSLLTIVAGLEHATGGSVKVDGSRAGPGPDRIVVFQDGALFPWLNVLRNVEFGLRMARVRRRARGARARNALRMVQLDRFAHARIHELSGGMKQRVALARALVLEPRVLLMDEPFGALDAQMRDELMGTIQELWKQSGATVLFVTHNVREAACLGDRAVVLSHRPGTVKGIVEIDAPRPRTINDPLVMEKAHDIGEILVEEIQWVRDRELRS